MIYAWINSKGNLASLTCPFENGNWICLPSEQPLQGLIDVMLGKPSTRFLSFSNYKLPLFKCLNLRCHSLDSSSTPITACADSELLISKGKSLRVVMHTRANKVFVFLCIIWHSPSSKSTLYPDDINWPTPRRLCASCGTNCTSLKNIHLSSDWSEWDGAHSCNL